MESSNSSTEPARRLTPHLTSTPTDLSIDWSIWYPTDPAKRQEITATRNSLDTVGEPRSQQRAEQEQLHHKLISPTSFPFRFESGYHEAVDHSDNESSMSFLNPTCRDKSPGYDALPTSLRYTSIQHLLGDPIEIACNNDLGLAPFHSPPDSDQEFHGSAENFYQPTKRKTRNVDGWSHLPAKKKSWQTQNKAASERHANSPFYHGSLEDPENKSALIPEHESCSVYIVSLPPWCTISILMQNLRGIGKVYASNINAPNAKHDTAAAKVVFFDRASVDRLMSIARAGHFTVLGYKPKVLMNRIRVVSQPPSSFSRAIRIEGPAHLVNFESLTAFFQGRFRYDLETVELVFVDGARTIMDWRFSSYRYQSSNAVKQITEQKKRIIAGVPVDPSWALVRVSWAADPCAF